MPEFAGTQIVGEQFPGRLAAAMLRRERYPSFATLTVAVQTPTFLQQGAEARPEGEGDPASAEWMDELASMDLGGESDSGDEVGDSEQDIRKDLLAQWRAFFSAFVGVEGVSLNVTFQDHSTSE